MMTARALADWATTFEPSTEDLALADRQLVDTVAVGLAAHSHPVLEKVGALDQAGRWAVACHVLDFDDLHMPSTTHISTVCIPVVLALGGGPRDFLAGAGVMARIGTALGWRHYSAGWHATTTAGALGAAAAAASCFGLDAEATMMALALAVPAAGGVQDAFGTDAKSIQIGLAADAGIRAARLARDGARANPAAVQRWLTLLGGDPADPVLSQRSPAVPDGLAIKIHPACYALQRPITAIAGLREGLDPESVTGIRLRTPAASVVPLQSHRPQTGLEGKFSLEYAAATALLDDFPGFWEFGDEAVNRPAAQRLLQLVETELTDGGEGLLTGRVQITVTDDRGERTAELDLPPGSPTRPPTSQELRRKVEECLRGLDIRPEQLTWQESAELFRGTLPHPRTEGETA
ncbi:2-methylcitrate dehydratase [Enemella evansiae]|uniref:2-methylcitrate dehydratase n=2 Tax=Enemella evansiae TaxID=2016499 RepID=A0A255GEP2_9ACTN|nr:2-methylcitrate dehydratase [Enemella evansiae]